MKCALNGTRKTVGFLLGFWVVLSVPTMAQLVDRTMAPNAAAGFAPGCRVQR